MRRTHPREHDERRAITGSAAPLLIRSTADNFHLDDVVCGIGRSTPAEADVPLADSGDCAVDGALDEIEGSK